MKRETRNNNRDCGDRGTFKKEIKRRRERERERGPIVRRLYLQKPRARVRCSYE